MKGVLMTLLQAIGVFAKVQLSSSGLVSNEKRNSIISLADNELAESNTNKSSKGSSSKGSEGNDSISSKLTSPEESKDQGADSRSEKGKEKSYSEKFDQLKSNKSENEIKGSSKAVTDKGTETVNKTTENAKGVMGGFSSKKNSTKDDATESNLIDEISVNNTANLAESATKAKKADPKTEKKTKDSENGPKKDQKKKEGSNLISLLHPIDNNTPKDSNLLSNPKISENPSLNTKSDLVESGSIFDFANKENSKKINSLSGLVDTVISNRNSEKSMKGTFGKDGNSLV